MCKKGFLNILKALGSLLFYIGIFYINGIIVDYILGLAGKTSFNDTMDILLNQWSLWVVLKFGLPMLIFMLIHKVRGINFFEFCRFKKMTLRDTALLCLTAVAGISFTAHFINTSFALKYIPEFDEYVSFAIKGNLFSVIAMWAILLPTCEEILFRGLIFNSMRKYLPLIAVLFTHHLLYMFMQPSIQVAGFAYINFTIYALIYVFAESIWAPILVEVIGAIGLFGTKMLGINMVIRGWGDGYLFAATIISAALMLLCAFQLKKVPLKQMFVSKTVASEVKLGV